MATTKSIEEIVRTEAARDLHRDITGKFDDILFSLKQAGLYNQYKGVIDEMIAGIYEKWLAGTQQNAIEEFVEKVRNGGK